MTWYSRHSKKILSFFAITVLCWLTPHTGRAGDGPIMQFAAEHLDLGSVGQGETPEGFFELQNIGDEPLIIEKIEPSCGCTAAVMESMEVGPGKKERIKVAVDTTGKERDIDKTILVTSNDSLRPQITLTLALQVEAQEHPDYDMGESLFSERCRSCHVDSGKGKRGARLYEAICYQCHGKNKEGASASALSGEAYLKKATADYLYEWIAKGRKGTAMAGYGKKWGGFLSKEEIDSLVDDILRPAQKDKE